MTALRGLPAGCAVLAPWAHIAAILALLAVTRLSGKPAPAGVDPALTRELSAALLEAGGQARLIALKTHTEPVYKYAERVLVHGFYQIVLAQRHAVLNLCIFAGASRRLSWVGSSAACLSSGGLETCARHRREPHADAGSPEASLDPGH